jgi:uncharacterized protein
MSLSAPDLTSTGVPRSPRSWGFLGTAIIALIAYCVQLLVALAAIMLLSAWHGVRVTASAKQGWMDVAVTVACPFALAVLWLAIRIARQRFCEYLALRWPGWSELTRGVALTIAVVFALSLLASVFGQTSPPSELERYQSLKDDGWLATDVATFSVAWPIMQEFLVRGFVFRGWSQSFLGPAGTVVLTSLISGLLALATLPIAGLAGLEAPYNYFDVSEIVVFDLLFGYLRYRSGSTLLTALLSSAVNVASTIEVALIVAYS